MDSIRRKYDRGFKIETVCLITKGGRRVSVYRNVPLLI